MLELQQRCVVMRVSRAWRRAAFGRPELWRVLDLVASDPAVGTASCTQHQRTREVALGAAPSTATGLMVCANGACATCRLASGERSWSSAGPGVSIRDGQLSALLKLASGGACSRAGTTVVCTVSLNPEGKPNQPNTCTSK